MGTESLRDTLTAAVEQVENSTIPAPEVTPETPAHIPDGQSAAPAAETAQQKADRERDEKGRFVDAKTKAPDKPPAGIVPPAPTKQAQTPPATPTRQRPSTWKKEHWEAYDKLATENPQLADYILQREAEFTRGVSTYKQEWDNAKPLIDAVQPFMPELERHGIQPAQWISNLGTAHHRLALGTPEEKLSMFAQLAREYQVPLEGLFVRGQDGQLYLNQNLSQPQQRAQPPAQQMRPEDISAIVAQQLDARTTQAEVHSFAQQQDKYPHFEAIREDMARLLEANLAEGLPDAYDAALRLPKHAELFKQTQEQSLQAEQAREAEEKRKAAEAARRKAISPRTSTPTSAVTQGQGKGLRATIEEAADNALAGRV